MSPVQRLVHLTARWTGDDQKRLADKLFAEGRETYRQTLQTQLNAVGCSGTKAVSPSVGPELKAIRDRANFAGDTVGNTYNVEMAREIIRIGQEVPTANRHVYASRLFYRGGWDGRYWQAKNVQIAQVETMTMVNAATADFWSRNGDLLEGQAVVRPYAAVCPICIEAVGGNPYKSVDEVYNLYELPVHFGCPHFADPQPKKLNPRECKLLWAG